MTCDTLGMLAVTLLLLPLVAMAAHMLWVETRERGLVAVGEFVLIAAHALACVWALCNW